MERAFPFLFVTFVFFAVNSPVARAQSAPAVSNVRAVQRADASRLVDILYNLSHSKPCTVWIAVSDDGGQSWGVPVRTLTGAVGNNIAPGLDRQITWDAAADIPGKAINIRVRVFADDSSPQGNMVFVAAGSFPYQRGNPLYVPSFWIDKYEVTNQRYAEFLNAADPDGEHWHSSMEITRTGAPPGVYYAVQPGRQNYPIRYVSFFDGDAYAAWLSQREGRIYRLPTEQEWEKAAAWDPTSNTHWQFGYQSNEYGCEYMNFNFCVGGPTEVGHYSGTAGTSDAHSYYGCYDMSGNVAEWTNSAFSPCFGDCRSFRGGSWDNDSSGCATTRRSGQASNLVANRGFRLVLDLN